LADNSSPKPVVMRGIVLRASDSGRVVTFRASTPTIDGHGSIVRPEGIKTERFESNPVFLWAHDGYRSLGGPPKIEHVIGRINAYARDTQAFDIDVEFATEEVNAWGEKAFRLVKAGFLNAVSIGFNPLSWHWETIEGREVLIFDSVELLEVSLVPIPSNPDAVALVRSLMAAAAITPPGGAAPQEPSSEDPLRAFRDSTPSVPGEQQAAGNPNPSVPHQPDAYQAIRSVLEAEILRADFVSAVRAAFRRSN
jgi:HK97 family phage prohead protease